MEVVLKNYRLLGPLLVCLHLNLCGVMPWNLNVSELLE